MHIGFKFKDEVSPIAKYGNYEDLKIIFRVHPRARYKELAYILSPQAFEPTIACV